MGARSADDGLVCVVLEGPIYDAVAIIGDAILPFRMKHPSTTEGFDRGKGHGTIGTQAFQWARQKKLRVIERDGLGLVVHGGLL